MATHTKAIAAGLVLALLTVLAAVSCGPGIAFLASLAAKQQCTSDGGVSTGGEVVPVPSGNPDAKLAFRAASWNVLKSNSVSNVAAGLQAAVRHRRRDRSAGVPGEVPRRHDQERPARLGLVEPEHLRPDHLERRPSSTWSPRTGSRSSA